MLLSSLFFMLLSQDDSENDDFLLAPLRPCMSHYVECLCKYFPISFRRRTRARCNVTPTTSGDVCMTLAISPLPNPSKYRKADICAAVSPSFDRASISNSLN